MKVIRRKNVVIAVLLALLLTVLYMANLYRTGNNMQSYLQSKYDEYAEGDRECLEEANQYISLSDDELDYLMPYLLSLMQTEIVDAGGEPGNDPQAVEAELVNMLNSASPGFLQSDLPGLLENVLDCRGASSPLYDEADSFQNWINGGSFATEWIRGSYPTDDLELFDYRSSNTVDGQDALDLMLRVADPLDSEGDD